MTTDRPLEDLLEVGAAPASPAPAVSRPRTSKIAKTALTLGVLAGVTGFASLLCEPPRNSYMFFDTSDALTATVLLTVLFSLLGLLLALIGLVRIAASKKTVKGYGHCLAGAGLAIAANAIWLIYFCVSL